MFIVECIIIFCSQTAGDGATLTIGHSTELSAIGDIGVGSLSFFITKMYDQCNVSVTLPPRSFVITAGAYGSPVLDQSDTIFPTLSLDHYITGSCHYTTPHAPQWRCVCCQHTVTDAARSPA